MTLCFAEWFFEYYYFSIGFWRFYAFPCSTIDTVKKFALRTK